MPLHTDLALQCADRIEAAVIAGDLHPGDVLDGHEALDGLPGMARAGAVAVLAYAGLVEDDGKGSVRVREVGDEEVAIVRSVRRHLELGSLADVARQHRTGSSLPIDAMAEAVELAEGARDDDDWDTAAMAHVLFHLAVIDLTGNPAAMRVMRGLSAIMRLAHHTTGSLQMTFADTIAQNRQIAELLANGQLSRAYTALEQHLLQLEGARS